jgi:hypothetical protein
MSPDLAITICFALGVMLFALVFAVYVSHEAHQARAERARAPERRDRWRGIG